MLSCLPPKYDNLALCLFRLTIPWFLNNFRDERMKSSTWNSFPSQPVSLLVCVDYLML